MQHGPVPDHAAFTDHARKARIGVNYGAILNVAALAHDDGIVVGSQHCGKPDRDISAKVNLSYDVCAGCDPGADVELGAMLP